MINKRRKEENMYNLVQLIGRLTSDPEIVKTESGKKVSHIYLAVQRTFKNTNGIYETDFIRCTLWDAIATRVCEYCHKGDLIAVRGQIRSSNYKDEKSENKYMTEVIVEKIVFLSTKNDNKETE